MSTYTAYLTTEHAEWLPTHTDLRANDARVDHEGQGIVHFDDDAMSILETFDTDDDGYIERDGARITMFIGGDAFPVVHNAAGDVAVLAATTAALPDMPPAARAVTARALVDGAKRVYSAAADAAVNDLTEWHRGRGGYAAVARLLGVSEAAVNKAVVRHRQRPD